MKEPKMIMWCVDCQKDFINPDGALYVYGAEKIKPNLKRLTEFANKTNITIVRTADFHIPSDKELSDKPDFVNTFPPHCMVNSEGSNFIPETKIKGNWSSVDYDPRFSDYNINIYANNILVLKNKFDVFEGNPHTDQLLKCINPDIAIVYGVATNVCVDYAVIGLRKRGIKVVVIEDAIKELPNLPLQPIFDHWASIGVGMIDARGFFEFMKSKYGR